MCLDIEHALKVGLVKEIENSEDDGYKFTKKFLDNNPRLITNIERSSSSPYISELIYKYFKIVKVNGNNQIQSYDECPIWVLVELMSFGDFILCYNYYQDYINKDNSEIIPKNIINLVRSIRNCCAHNNCLIHNLKPNEKNVNEPQKISKL